MDNSKTYLEKCKKPLQEWIDSSFFKQQAEAKRLLGMNIKETTEGNALHLLLNFNPEIRDIQPQGDALVKIFEEAGIQEIKRKGINVTIPDQHDLLENLSKLPVAARDEQLPPPVAAAQPENEQIAALLTRLRESFPANMRVTEKTPWEANYQYDSRGSFPILAAFAKGIRLIKETAKKGEKLKLSESDFVPSNTSADGLLEELSSNLPRTESGRLKPDDTAPIITQLVAGMRGIAMEENIMASSALEQLVYEEKNLDPIPRNDGVSINTQFDRIGSYIPVKAVS
jgi:hypothetical protein